MPRKQTIYFYESYLTWINTEPLIKLTGICDGLPGGRGNRAEKKIIMIKNLIKTC